MTKIKEGSNDKALASYQKKLTIGNKKNDAKQAIHTKRMKKG